jgi:putative endonuclease
MFAWLRRFIDSWRGASGAGAPALSRDDGAGAEGERLAADWLAREKRMRILARNWRAPRDRRLELDLVADDGGVLVFVEVKARPAHAMVPGYFAAVQPRKKKALLRAARAYVTRLREKPRTVRFDVVEVVHDADRPGTRPEVRHFENVPLFPKEFLRGR